MHMNDAFDELRPVVRRAARSVEFQWPGVIDASDVEQEIYLRLLESPASLEKIRRMEDAARYRAVVGMGHQIASAERTDYDHFAGNYRYSVGEVKELLSRGILTGDWDADLDAVIDLEAGMEAIADRPLYRFAIEDRYTNGVVPQSTTEKTRLSRALTTLADEMNRSNNRRWATRDDGPGSRTAVSNAKAQRLTGGAE